MVAMNVQKLIQRAALSLPAPGPYWPSLYWPSAVFLCVYFVFVWAGTASAQTNNNHHIGTPVRTSMHISGACSKCDLSRRVMPGLSLQGANFSGSNFSHSNLAGAKLNRSKLNNTSFHKAYLMRVSGVGVNLNHAELRGTTLSEAKLIASNFTMADLRKADLTGSDFSRSDFSRAKLISTDAMGAVFAGAVFYKSNLGRGDFTGADFTDAQFIDTKFGDANVANANFSGANLSGSSLYKIVGLSQKQLDVACGSSDTHLPAGFSLKTCPQDSGLNTSLRTPIIPPTAQNLPSQAAINISTVKIKGPASHHNIDLEEAISLIDKSIRDLPLDSPTRIRLTQAHDHLEKVRTASGK